MDPQRDTLLSKCFATRVMVLFVERPLQQQRKGRGLNEGATLFPGIFTLYLLFKDSLGKKISSSL